MIVTTVMSRPRKPKPMKWHVYVARRRVSEEALLTVNKLRSYDALVDWCNRENIEAPTHEEIKGKFVVKRAPKPEPAPEPEPVPVVVTVPALPIDEEDTKVVDELVKRSRKDPRRTKLTKAVKASDSQNKSQ